MEDAIACFLNNDDFKVPQYVCIFFFEIVFLESFRNKNDVDVITGAVLDARLESHENDTTHTKETPGTVIISSILLIWCEFDL
jgi:hypothetical protein